MHWNIQSKFCFNVPPKLLIIFGSFFFLEVLFVVVFLGCLFLIIFIYLFIFYKISDFSDSIPAVSTVFIPCPHFGWQCIILVWFCWGFSFICKAGDFSIRTEWGKWNQGQFPVCLDTSEVSNSIIPFLLFFICFISIMWFAVDVIPQE